ncbi:hypothetical protein ACH5RR_035582 [Cinchona calisaya]|uniref:PB1 domain-containing protein n=1 Tax=Cinchona calisaya TaxID=153742 RepID=A0ABD2Y0W3_9GENT
MISPMFNSYKYNNLTLKSASTTIKFLCSYGGKILPRYSDGKLRYHGGETRVLAVERAISFSELVVKLGEMCGTTVNLRCQLPTEDMDALVSITSDEDLANLIEEYDRAAASASASSSQITSNTLKIRAFIAPPKKLSPTPSIASSSSNSNDATSPNSSLYSTAATASLISSKCPKPAANDRCIHQIMARPAIAYPHPLISYEKTAAKMLPHQYGYYGPGKTGSHIYLIHHGNHWQ